MVLQVQLLYGESRVQLGRTLLTVIGQLNCVRLRWYRIAGAPVIAGPQADHPLDDKMATWDHRASRPRRESAVVDHWQHRFRYTFSTAAASRFLTSNPLLAFGHASAVFGVLK